MQKNESQGRCRPSLNQKELKKHILEGISKAQEELHKRGGCLPGSQYRIKSSTAKLSDSYFRIPGSISNRKQSQTNVSNVSFNRTKSNVKISEFTSKKPGLIE